MTGSHDPSGDRAEADVADPDWLRGHVADVLDFYYPTCVDEARGGFVAQLDERTGEVYDPRPRHLVASCRFVVNFARGHRLGLGDWCLPAAARGVDFLLDHQRADNGGYHWLLDGTTPVDDRRSPYGHAFAMLALSEAADVGVERAAAALSETTSVVEKRFWEPEQGLARSELDADWNPKEPYRGQNANMHLCEASLVAYETTGDDAHLDRAMTIARRFTVDLAAETDGRLWEHFDEDWAHDFEYNVDEPAHLFRPWGYQPGHHAEWAKLLAQLSRHRDDPWLVERATEIFDYAVESGWDDEYGGFYYTVDPGDDPVVDDKYGWPVAEAIGAAATLADVADEADGVDGTDETYYRDWYDRLWTYALDNLVGPGGNWYAELTRENEYVDTNDGPAVEPGYHPIGACVASLQSLD